MKVTAHRFGISALFVVLMGCAGITRAQQKPAAATPKPAVPFVENDYTRALADAHKRNVPLFVDLWAPW